ncbi:MAG: hypothetical protein ABI599_03165 [Flavobacteriales bacterium]
MKQFTLLTIAIGLHCAVQGQQGVMVKQSAGVSTFIYTSAFLGDDIEAAIALCNPLGGDTLILPGGSFNLTGINNNLLIDRPVVLIGAGYYDPSNLVTTSTVITGLNDVVLLNNADGTSIHGIDFDMNGGSVYFSNAGTQNVSFFRCEFTGLEFGTTGAGAVNSQIHVQECVIGSMNGWSATSVTIDNCVFGSAPQGFFTGGLTMRNCVVHSWNNASAGAGNSYYNCILMRNGSGTGLAEVSCFNDCLFVCTSGVMTQGSATCPSNPVSSGLAGVFDNVTSITTYSQLFDYGIPNTSPAYALDADIYQGPAPWKDGAVPFNAHWTGLTVPGNTNGGLIQNVVIQGQAQSH